MVIGNWLTGLLVWVEITNYVLTNYALTNYVLTNYALTNYVLTNYALTNYVLTNYVLTNYVLTNYALTNYVLTNYVLTNYVLTNYAFTNYAYSMIWRKRLLRWLPWLLALGLLWLVGRTIPLAGTWAALRRLRGWQIVALLAANGLVLLAMNGRWAIILRGQGYHVPWLTLLGYRLAAFGLSYFTPGPQFGGEPAQVYFLERDHGIPRPAAVAALAVDKAQELTVNFAFLAAGVLVVLQGGLFAGVVGMEAALFALGLLALPVFFLAALGIGRRPVSGLLLMAGKARPLQDRPAYQKIIQTAQESEAQVAQLTRAAPLFLVGAFFVSLLGWLALIGEFWLMMTFLGLPLTAVQTITALTAARIAFLLPLPGGLGTLEASQVLVLGMMGFDPALGISASLLIRARDVLLGGLGLWWGGRQLRRP